jgi:HEAT repeat protein
MDPVTITLALGAAAGGAIFQARRLRARRAAWRRAAESCGLEDLTETRRLGAVTGLHARRGVLRVSIGVRGARRATSIVVHGIADVALRGEGFETALQKRLRVQGEVEVGDPTFDEAVYLEGPPAVLQAVLDASTRLAVRRLLQGTLYDAGRGTMFMARARLQGKVEIEVGEGVWGFARSGLPLALHSALDLAQRLTEPEDVARRLARNAKEDPLAEVRRRNLAMLEREFPDHPALPSALRGACQDRDDDVRLHAAAALGEEGHAVLRRLAASSGDEGCAAAALRALGSATPAPDALDLLAGAMRRQRYALARACLEALGGRGGAAATAALSQALGAASADVAVAAAQALGHADLPGAAAVLLERGLGHAQREVRVAAAEALGRVAGVDAVLPLRELAAQADGPLRRAAREAVAQIQSRISGAAPGQVTVAGGEGGTLSLASDGGEVSLAPREPA